MRTVYQLRVVHYTITQAGYLGIIQLSYPTFIEHATTLTKHNIHGIVVAAQHCGLFVHH